MEMEVLFLSIASIVAIGFLADLVFRKTKFPDIVILLLLGVLVGPVFNLLPRENFTALMPFISSIALLMILFNGGLNLDLYKMMKKAPRAVLLAVTGFGLAMISTGAASYLLLNLSALKSLLLGAIVGGVSSAIVIPVVTELEGFAEDSRLTLEIESVITDPLCIIVAIVIMDLIVGTNGVGLSSSVLSPGVARIVSMFSVSIVVGLVSGLFWLEILQHIKGEKYHYMITLAYLFFVYAAAEMIGGNGAISSFMIGLVLGNGSKIRDMFKIEKKYFGLTEKTKAFQDQISFFVKTFFFVFLGGLITLHKPELFIYGLVFTVIILISRFVSVELSSLSSGFNRLERSIMAFMTPRGLAAAVLATIPAAEYGIPGTEIFPEVVFSIILGTAVISTLGVFIIEKRVKKPRKEKDLEIDED
ncbi:MAG: cation:proton antiporter [Candidatus Aenigmatarchaeota archaeon]